MAQGESLKSQLKGRMPLFVLVKEG